MFTNLQKSLARLAPFALAGIALSLSSCIIYEDSGPPYGTYRSTPSTSGYRSSAYGGPRPYYRDRYDDYGHGHHHGHHSYSHKEDRIKLTAGQQRGKSNRPEGYHTREWYEKRGYDLDKFKHKHEHSGKTHSGSSYKKKSSSSSRSRSSSSRSRSSRSSSSRSRSSSSRSKSSSDRDSKSRKKR